MQVWFASSKLQKLLSSEKELVRRFGKKCAEELMDRMATLEAMPRLVDVPSEPPERRHKLYADRKGQWSVDGHGGVRLCFKPANDPLPLLPNGEVDVEQVTEIEIVFVGDTHRG
ncbi:killer suppression protein HigA [Rhodocista pekingensis]|uniref:Killer suppression protein HigA n=1 Tax=Rhodocista pekingensis TaxID=201185 RepID=A0ABW2L078_9PROT